MMRALGNLLIVLGMLMLLTAGGITGYSFHTAEKAGEQAVQMTETLTEYLTEHAPEPIPENLPPYEVPIPDYLLAPKMEMPTVIIDGESCIGILEIPSLGIWLPILSEWSDAKLYRAPCRYEGSAYTDNLVIAGHNYKAHFGPIRRLKAGDAVYFTDADGNRFDYEVVLSETLPEHAVQDMLSGDWDLSLFTCDFGGSHRLTVRCEKIQ